MKKTTDFYIKEAKILTNKIFNDLNDGRHFIVKSSESKPGSESKKIFSYLDYKGDGSQLFEKEIGFPRLVKSAVVGIDIKRYTKRNWLNQAIISIFLYGTINKAIDYMHISGILDKDQPLVKQPTGDGAYIGFEERKPNENDGVMNSLMFVLILNIILEEYNWHEIFTTEKNIPMFPIKPRFSINYGEMYLIMDLTGTLSFAGESIVTSARLLSIDKGNHFIVSDEFMKSLRNNINRALSNTALGNWETDFSMIEFMNTKIKGKNFEFVNICGTYYDTPLLRLLGRSTNKPMKYNLGSTDTKYIES